MLAIDENSQPLNGYFRSMSGDNPRIEFYKNRICVHSGDSAKPVADIKQGELKVDDVTIRAIRGPRDGIYAVVTETVYPYTIDGLTPDYSNPLMRMMVGCGVYGYSGDHWDGIGPGEIVYLAKYYADIKSNGALYGFPEVLSFVKALRINQGNLHLALSMGDLSLIQATPIGAPSQPILPQVARRFNGIL